MLARLATKTRAFIPRLAASRAFSFGDTGAANLFKTTSVNDGDKYDVVIAGGGVIGSSVAYNLAIKDPTMKILVVERDPTYAKSSTMLSAASIRNQFSTPTNVDVSLYGSKFLMNMADYLTVDGEEPADCQFVENGYLFLGNEHQRERMEFNVKMQTERGAKVKVVESNEIKSMFPYMNVDDVDLGTWGLANEGWFDSWLILSAYKRKAQSLGVSYAHASVVGAEKGEDGQISGTVVQEKGKEPKTIKAPLMVNAGGAYASEITEMCGLEPEPVTARKRTIFFVHCPNPEVVDCPMVVDTSGCYFRREGESGNFIASISPKHGEEDPAYPYMEGDEDLDVNHDAWMDLWMMLFNRVPAFEELKVESAWAGFYEFNSFDENAFIGKHPHLESLILCNGFSGHGLMQAPAAGRGVAELIVDGGYKTIDMSPFGYERWLNNEPVQEKAIL
eukprot:TRINITY_DN11762_c1_g1_i1.p1 TRINITY_DN11762_c1_g1~~TRINITY_DN11762_c1_g1_i1.p1  ORF type:complete len:447 (-),score=142.85 TRINITY_DN11762_c1_g1_i1:659-1999(-)